MVVSSVKTEVVLVTPELAREWLKRNVSNRPLNEAHAQRLARLMVEGRWMVSSDGIAFDSLNRLINGQHRLRAIVISETSQQMLVVTGVPSESFQVIDTGSKRTGGDALAILGYKNYNMLASAARLAVIFERTGAMHYTTSRVAVHNDDIVKAVEKHPAIVDSVQLCRGWNDRFRGWISPSLVAFLHFLYSRDYPKEAHSFVEGLATGANLQSGSPVLHLRNRLIGRSEVDKLVPGIKTALSIVAFNHHVRGRKVRFLRWSPGQGQRFPQPDVTPLSEGDVDSSKEGDG